MTRSPGFLDYTKKNFIEQLGFLSSPLSGGKFILLLFFDLFEGQISN